MRFLEIFSINTAAAGPIDSAPRVASILTNILNFLLSVVGVVAIISIVIAGAMYFFAAGNERAIDTAKKAITFSIIGLVIALGGLVLIKTLGSLL